MTEKKEAKEWQGNQLMWHCGGLRRDFEKSTSVFILML